MSEIFIVSGKNVLLPWVTSDWFQKVMTKEVDMGSRGHLDMEADFFVSGDLRRWKCIEEPVK